MTSLEGQISRRPREAVRISGRVIGFDALRSFGFIASDQCEGNVLFHSAHLREHNRHGLPVGAVVDCLVERQDRGLYVQQIISIDLSEVVISQAVNRDRHRLNHAVGPFEPVEVRWFIRTKGFGFLNRKSDPDADIFVHMETAKRAGLIDLQPGDWLEARIAEGQKGLTAVEVRKGPASPRS